MIQTQDLNSKRFTPKPTKSSEGEISFIEFSGVDTSDTFQAAMASLRKHPGTTFVIPPGEYHLTSELARQTQKKVIQGEYGSNPQNFIFKPNFPYTKGIDFSGQKETTVKAYGVTFVVDGFMEVLSLMDCEGITLEGFSIDHLRKPFSLGKVTEVIREETGCKVRVVFDARYPIEKESPLMIRIGLYQPSLRRTEQLRPLAAEWISSQAVVYKLHDYRPDLLNGEFYTWHSAHFRPAIRIENAKDISLQNITLHSQPGMGVVGHRSENLSLKNLHVVPSVGTHLSTNTDATHFTSCKGYLKLDGCVFDGQGDDSLNVHTYFHTLSYVRGKTCRLSMDFKDGTHTQTLDYPDVGDVLELTSRDGLEVSERFRVLSCVPHFDEDYSEVSVDHELPSVAERYFLANITRLPTLEFTNCLARNHFARGILVKTRGALIENNTFEDLAGIGIELAAESWWHEGVCPADVIVRRNSIINCASAKSAAITVMPDCEHPSGTPIKNITLEDNLIDCPEAPYGIIAKGVSGLIVRRNQINCKLAPVLIQTCEQVDYKPNSLINPT